MEGLLEKIKKFTLDGSPTVTELIELQEIARKIKVSRTDLEKMINQSLLAVNKLSEPQNIKELATEKENSYERPNYDTARNSFEVEMNKRRASESIPERPEITFNRPEVVFPKMDDPFAKKGDTTKEGPIVSTNKQVGNELSYDVESLKELEKDKFDRTSKQMMEEQHALEVENKRKQEEQLKKYQLEAEKYRQDKPKQEPASEKPKVSIDGILGEVSGSKNEVKEAVDSTFKTTSFDIEFEKLKETNQKDNLDDWIKNSNKEALERVETLTEKQNKIKQQKRKEELKRRDKIEPKISAEEWLKTPSKAQRSKKESKNKKKRSFDRDKAKTISLKSKRTVKSAFMLGIGSLVLSIVFGGLGAALAVFALKSSRKDVKEIKANPQFFEKGALSKVKNGRIMAIFAIVIGVVKFSRIFYWKFFLF